MSNVKPQKTFKFSPTTRALIQIAAWQIAQVFAGDAPASVLHEEKDRARKRLMDDIRREFRNRGLTAVNRRKLAHA